jgi:hypothetical protein
MPDDPGQEGPWPAALTGVFAGAVTAEYASLTREGTPVTVPTTPYVGDGTLDISTGLTYPTKAERARRNPRVALLFADPVGAGGGGGPVVSVQGMAAVRDADLQANTDRYVRQSVAKLPDATKGQPRFVLRRMAWYYVRIWVEIAPVRVLWWPDRSLAGEPRVWTAPERAWPTSDPAPEGSSPPAWRPPPTSWSEEARHALDTLPLCDLTVVDPGGFPLAVPVTHAAIHPEGFSLTVGTGAPWPPVGPGLDGLAACLTFHTHGERFTGQENRTFVGRFDPASGVLEVDRALADWSLAGGRARIAVGFLGSGRRLRPRLAAQAARRHQPVPKVRFPGEY